MRETASKGNRLNIEETELTRQLIGCIVHQISNTFEYTKYKFYRICYKKKRVERAANTLATQTTHRF